MKSRTVVWLFAVVLSISCVFCAAKTQEFQNDTGAVATGIRIVFSSIVAVTAHDAAFPVMQPEDRAREFVFSGGSVRPFDTFFVSWNTAASVVRFEWLTEQQTGLSKPVVRCSYTASPTRASLSEVISTAWDGAVFCLEPGTYQVDSMAIAHSITLRGMGQTASDVVITGPKYQPQIIFTTEDATVVLDNLSFPNALLCAYEKSHLILKNVIAYGVNPDHESTLDIERSILRRNDSSGLAILAGGGALVSIRHSVVEGGIQVMVDVQLVVLDSLFQGPTSLIGASGGTRIEVRNCEFDPLSRGIRLVPDFTGTVLGEGNVIASSALYPPGYPWPAGFIK